MTSRRGQSEVVADEAPEVTEVTEGTETVVEVGATPEVDYNMRTQFGVVMPLGLKIELEKRAKATDVSAGEIAKRAIAQALGYTLPDAKARSGGQKKTDEQKKAEQKARNQKQRETLKAMLALARQAEGLAVETGVEDDDDEVDDEEDDA